MQWLQDWAYDWQGFISIVFMVVLVVVFLKMAKGLPKTKPQQIKPDTKQAIAWEDIAGADQPKAELQEVVDFLKDPKAFQRLGAKAPKGVLLHGPPGTGKTLLAKAVAHESGAEFFAQSASSFVEMFAGLGAARIRRLFREARKASPAIIFIDELDAVGAVRGSDNSSEREQTLNQLLVEMDGFPDSGDIVVMAASNLLEKLDPALLRPGRFDRQVYVAPPGVEGRREILAVHTRNKPTRDVDLDLVARQTSGLTGADLANLCNEAAIRCARRKGHALVQDDFEKALERVVAGVESSRRLTDHERRVVAWHEAGHALCGELLPSVDRPHKVSIVPRGSALGFAMSLPEEDRYLKTREDLIDYMTVLLGGRAAEQLVFGSVTTGAANDLQKVAEITHAMVQHYAMGSSATGPRAWLDLEVASETSRRMRDEEQRELALEAERAAAAILSAHRGKLDELAAALLEREVLERHDLDRILGDVPRLKRSPSTALRLAAADPTPPSKD
ncbi:MAG TPA: AAA family ATPase [Solirubrobacteraceae bacterium]|nr:AAA family ATPase [Solirubrobacteraceae bacterium]